MYKKLEKLNWEPFAYKRLNELIKEYSQDEISDPSSLNYCIFDFDETIVTGDIEENLMIYIVNNFKFKMQPDQLKNHFLSNLIDPNKKLEEGKFTCLELIEDIYDSYKYLREKGYSNSSENIEKEEHFKSLRAKMVYYYYNSANFAKIEKDNSWPRFYFVGYSKDEMEVLSKNMLDEMTKLGPKKYEFQTSKIYQGRAGLVKSSFVANLRFNPEIVNLFEVLKENNIIANIVSASPIALVESVCKNSPLKLSEYSKIYAMRHTYDREGKISPILDKDFPITKKEGKSKVIEDFIKPNFKYKDPIAVFGDSMGDFDMLTKFEDTSISLLFNRNLDDKTNLIKKRAKNSYGKDQARYLVQGKNYKKSSFIESTSSIIF